MTRLLALGLAVLSLATVAQGADGGYASAVQRLSPGLQRTLTGTYWKPGCPVPLSDLRVLTVRHWDFAGKPRTGQLIVNRRVAEPLRTAFRRLYEAKFAIRHLQLDVYRQHDRLPANGDVSGSFECRQSVPSPCVGGTASGRWSNHAYGLAIDLNPHENPYVGCGKVRDPARRAFLDRSRARKGMVTSTVVDAFAAIGWGWGGAWTGRTKDYMHFSATGG